MRGSYLISGGGWYFRKNWLSRNIAAGSETICTPAWLWWGFTCTSGTELPTKRWLRSPQTRGALTLE
jgi:hypothetical protein